MIYSASLQLATSPRPAALLLPVPRPFKPRRHRCLWHPHSRRTSACRPSCTSQLVSKLCSPLNTGPAHALVVSRNLLPHLRVQADEQGVGSTAPRFTFTVCLGETKFQLPLPESLQRCLLQRVRLREPAYVASNVQGLKMKGFNARSATCWQRGSCNRSR